MRIKWRTLGLPEAMDMVEEYLKEAAKPLSQAKTVPSLAKNIPNTPEYIPERLGTLIVIIEQFENIQKSISIIRQSLQDNTHSLLSSSTLKKNKRKEK